MYPTLISFSRSDVSYQAERINRLLKKNLAHEIGATNSPVQKIAHLQPTLAMARIQKARSTRKRAGEW
jgi:hypothetical protein